MSGENESIRAEWRLLLSQWKSARTQWRDPVALRFERDFWRQYEEEVPRFLQILDQLDDVLERALGAST